MKTLATFLGILCFAFAPAVSFAATLSISPPASEISAGSVRTVTVSLASTEQAVNAVSGTISFPTDKLKIVSVSKENSIVNFWAREPSFSNSTGTIDFEGVILNPGFSGAQGKVLAIEFRAEGAGKATVSFSSGSILANDGNGTEILNGLGNGQFVITEATAPKSAAQPAEVSEGARKPEIFSSTHPDQTKWYNSDDLEFSWVLPQGALEVKTLLGSNPDGVPTILYNPPISSRKIEGVGEGTYYFHLQVRTKEGWGSVAHFKVNIDTTPPEKFSITFPHGKEGLDPQPVILFNTSDAVSGVSRYDIKVGSGGPERLASSAHSNPYPLPPQYPGTHQVTVIARDFADNITSASAEFTVQAIESPIITYYPEEIESGDVLKIRGTTYENSDVTVQVKEDGGLVTEELTRSNSLGDFALIVGKELDPGIYTFTARVTDSRGARSDETAPLTVIVNSEFLTDLSRLVLDYMSVAILIILSIAGIAGLTFHIWCRFSSLIKRMNKEGKEAERVIEKSFALLKRDIHQHMDRLRTARDRRKLTPEETTFLEEFEESLSDAEAIITKEVKDIRSDKQD